MKLLWSVVLAVAVGLAVACSGGGDSASPTATSTSAAPRATLPPFPTRAPQPTSTPVATYDTGTRTEIDVIDGVLEALEARDDVALTGMLSFHPYRCNNVPLSVDGANPCPPGVSEGSPVDVIAMGGCEVAFLARERANLGAKVADFVREAAGQGVFAVTEVQTGRLSSPLPIRYLIILSGGYALLLDDSGITHLAIPCAGVEAATLYHPADRPILPPQ